MGEIAGQSETDALWRDAGALLREHEGFRSRPYRDTVGKLTIGIGRNLDDRGISLAEANVMLGNDIGDAVRDLSRYVFWESASHARRIALINFRFQLGLAGFQKFKNTIAKLNAGDWGGAADAMLASKWAAQVPRRAKQITEMIRVG